MQKITTATRTVFTMSGCLLCASDAARMLSRAQTTAFDSFKFVTYTIVVKSLNPAEREEISFFKGEHLINKSHWPFQPSTLQDVM